MKKLLGIALALLPSLCFADRLGSLRSSADVLLSTQGANLSSVIHSTESLQSGATFYVSSGTIQGPLYLTGSGNGQITTTISGSTYTVTASSSGSYSVGQAAVFSSTSGTLIGGGSGVAVGGTGTQIQYRVDATTLGGIPNSSVWSSSVTVSTFGVLSGTNQSLNRGFAGLGNTGVLDVYSGSVSTNRTLFAVGSTSQNDQFYVPNNNQVVAALGIQGGQLVMGDTTAAGQRIYSNGDINSFFDLRNGSTATLNTGTANGPGDIRMQPASKLMETLSTQSGVTVTSSFTAISSPGNNGATPYAIISASGSPTYGAGWYDPDFYQLYNSASGKACIGFGQGGDTVGGLQPMAICRAAALDELDFGFKSITGGEANPLSITTNGNFPQGSSVTVNGDLIVASGDIEGPSIKNAGISGMYISSGVYSYTNPDIITATSTITSTMSVVMASCTTRGATPNAWITLTLPSATLVPGFNTTIYDLGADSCSIRVNGNGTDLIEGTGTIQLDAQTQHASLRSLGATGWGSGPGGVQATPYSLFTTQDDVGTFAVATSSLVYSCPVYVPVPLAVMGFRLNRGANSGWISTALTDLNGKYVVGVSTQLTVNGSSNYITGIVTPVAPGWYRWEYTANNTATLISGSNSAATPHIFCSTVGTDGFGLDLSQFVPTLPGTATSNTYPAVDLIINGGLQGF